MTQPESVSLSQLKHFASEMSKRTSEKHLPAHTLGTLYDEGFANDFSVAKNHKSLNITTNLPAPSVPSVLLRLVKRTPNGTSIRKSPQYFNSNINSNSNELPRLSFTDLGSGQKLPGLVHLSLQDYWREYTKALAQDSSDLVCRGQSAIDWDTEFRRHQLSRQIFLGRPATEQYDKADKRMIDQQNNKSSQLQVGEKPDGPLLSSKLSSLIPMAKTVKSKKIRRRLIRQIKRREEARKFLTSSNMTLAPPDGEEAEDTSGDESSQREWLSNDQPNSTTDDGNSNNIVHESSQPIMEQMTNDDNHLGIIDDSHNDESEDYLFIPTLIGDEVSVGDRQPPEYNAEAECTTAVEMNSNTPAVSSHGSDNIVLLESIISPLSSQPQAKSDTLSKSPAERQEDEENKAKKEIVKNPDEKVSPSTGNIAETSLEQLAKNAAGSAPESKADLESKDTFGESLVKFDVCRVCGVHLPPDVRDRRDGYSYKQKVGKNNYYGSGTGISSKSALVNWFSTRMTNDQMLMVASFDDEVANFLLSCQPKSVLSSTPSSHSVPSGWLPNSKMTGCSKSAPVKRRAAGNSQTSQQLSMRSNYFGYHDSRRKMPIGGVFRHFEKPEDHARFYRLQFTVGDAGRCAEIWRHAHDPSRLDPNRQADEMLLHHPTNTKDFSVSQQTFRNTSDDSSNKANSDKLLIKNKQSSGNGSVDSFEYTSTISTVGNTTSTTSCQYNSNNYYTNPSPLKTTRPTSDAYAVGTGPTLMWPSHEKPATVVSSNSNQAMSAATPGPWPIRPWTLAQLEGKKTANAKISGMASSIKPDDSQIAASSSPLSLKPVPQPTSGNSSNNQPSSGSSSGGHPGGVVKGSRNGRQPPAGVSTANLEVLSLPIRDESSKPGYSSSATKNNNTGYKANHADLIGIGTGSRIEKTYRKSKLNAPAPMVNKLSVGSSETASETSSNNHVKVRNRNNKHNPTTRLAPIANPGKEQELEARRAAMALPANRPHTSNMPKEVSNPNAVTVSSTMLLPFSSPTSMPKLAPMPSPVQEDVVYSDDGSVIPIPLPKNFRIPKSWSSAADLTINDEIVNTSKGALKLNAPTNHPPDTTVKSDIVSPRPKLLVSNAGGPP